jgi:phenylalanyl-tRNA synthetase beta subunit
MIHNWYENMLYYMIKSIFGEYLAALERKKKAKKLMSFSKSNVKHIAVKKRRRKKTRQRLWCPQKIKEETTKASANTAKEVIKLVCSKQQKEPYKQQTQKT